MTASDEQEVRVLYRRVLEGWNARDAQAFAASFAEDGASIGFDGSELAGRAAIVATLRGIFADHATGRYVAVVRGVTPLARDAALLRAVCGMVPAGKADLDPALHALQTLIAVKRDGVWRIVLFQNTPAQLHGRPQAVEQLTEELRRAL
jgi:uncharacterized protein (TIGR02246 family)